ncbi:energy transducer TonB [Sorangium sp. So ce185]|uniref:energy transducer TonB n=1 Tax=Sorangium sp. So ce185 TaxID=3133287 RepID=UPI003F5E6CB1
MERPSRVIATLLLLPLWTATACEATTAAMPGAAQQDAARERPARRGTWACGFPEEAEKNGIDEGTVVIRVYVDFDGFPRRAMILQDPGHGFGSAAAECAMTKRYVPMKDRYGSPIPGWTPPITVRYVKKPQPLTAR